MRESWGYKVQAEDLTRRGQIARMEGAQAVQAGKAAQSGSRWAAAGDILGGAASVATIGQRYGFKKAAAARGPGGDGPIGQLASQQAPGKCRPSRRTANAR